jgi:4-aminobutyrate aminotransferase
MDWEPGSHGTTFGGNPVSCAAALATLEVLSAGLVANSAKVGAFMLKELTDRLLDHPMVGDIRGRGLMIGVEIVKDKRTKERAPQERDAIVQKCFEKGLLLLGSGANTVRMMPPLVITKEEAKVGLDIFEEVLLEVLLPRN